MQSTPVDYVQILNPAKHDDADRYHGSGLALIQIDKVSFATSITYTA
jgi:hypothetical protein